MGQVALGWSWVGQPLGPRTRAFPLMVSISVMRNQGIGTLSPLKCRRSLDLELLLNASEILEMQL